MSTFTADASTDVRPFQVEIPDADLADLRRRIEATRWPSEELVADRSQGVQLTTLQALARYWATEYDMGRIEARLNALPQFMTDTRPLWTQLLVMAATTVTVDVVVMHGYAFGASALRRLMRSARAVRTQNRVFGGLLMAVGAGLFFVKRGGQHA